MITGEAKPVKKTLGNDVIAGTINGDGILKIKVAKIGENTFLAGVKSFITEKHRLQNPACKCFLTVRHFI